jgi:MOSC domain-containing protein YiiM
MIVNHTGKVLSIYVRPEPSKQVVPLDQTMAVPGKGLEGDYYFAGITPKGSDASREVTLIEQESIIAIERENKIALNPGDSRRNLVTENVALNHLVGKEFRIGEVILKGVRLCEPCSHLGDLTQNEVLPALVHRGGLRAQILNKGTIRVGDPVYILESDRDEEARHAEPDQ